VVAHLEFTMSTKRSGQQTCLKPAFAVPVPALGLGDLTLMQLALGEIAPDWSVELQGICAGEATLVVLPDGGDDGIGPSFLISRETYGLRMDQVHWDVMTEVGVFASLHDVINALQPWLALCSVLTAPASAMLH
jgi:hypothetical protein